MENNNIENSEAENKEEAENKDLNNEEIFAQKEKKQIKISLVGLIFIIMFIILFILIGIVFVTNESKTKFLKLMQEGTDNNSENTLFYDLYYNPFNLRRDENDLEDVTISKYLMDDLITDINEEKLVEIIGISKEEFENYKKHFIGSELFYCNNETIKKQEKEFLFIENFILMSDDEISECLYQSMKNKEIRSKIHSRICSGIINYYFENVTNIYEISEIKELDNEIQFKINNEYLFSFKSSNRGYKILVMKGYYSFDENYNNKDICLEFTCGYFEHYFEGSDNTPTKKPIIYIYPEEETEVNIKLERPELLTTTYPKYTEEGWNVIAKPDGILTDCKTGRNLYALYWEGINSRKYSENIKEGFVIPGKETATFLEEKLEILGLNEREAEEFIVYWLPQMEHNNYNYIRFQKMEEIEENMPLEIIPAPETLIRVMMEWKSLDEKIEIKEEQLEKVERKGYTVIEWGGTEIENNSIIK